MKKNGEFLKKYREEFGYTQKELAEKLNININTIQNIEQNKRSGSDETWEKILKSMEESKKNNFIVYSIDSEEIIEKINQDIAELGENELCYIFYKTNNGRTEFIDCISKYDINQNIIENYLEQEIFYIETKLKYALKLFEIQDKIL